MDFVVLDIEAERAVEDWARPWEAGMSCAVTYHPRDLFKIWTGDDLPILVEYLRLQALIVGYNITHYDLPVIEQLAGQKIERPLYDLCTFASKALNRRVKACEVLDATLGLQKTANGIDAPRFYAEGDTRSLWEYCLNDVLLEFLLFRFARDNGYLLVENRGRLIACPCPDPSEVAYGF